MAVASTGPATTRRPQALAAAWKAALGDRPVTVVNAAYKKALDLRVVSVVDSFQDLPGGSIWPALIPDVLDQIENHQTTLVFANSRRQAERAADRLNDLWLSRQAGGEGGPEALIEDAEDGEIAGEQIERGWEIWPLIPYSYNTPVDRPGAAPVASAAGTGRGGADRVFRVTSGHLRDHKLHAGAHAVGVDVPVRLDVVDRLQNIDLAQGQVAAAA